MAHNLIQHTTEQYWRSNNINSQQKLQYKYNVLTSRLMWYIIVRYTKYRIKNRFLFFNYFFRICKCSTHRVTIEKLNRYLKMEKLLLIIIYTLTYLVNIINQRYICLYTVYSFTSWHISFIFILLYIIYAIIYTCIYHHNNTINLFTCKCVVMCNTHNFIHFHFSFSYSTFSLLRIRFSRL